MRIKELKPRMLKLLAAGLPLMIKGAPGVGKSDLVSQVTEELGWNMILTHPVVSDPTDYKGLPGIVNGKAEFLPFGDLRQMIEAKQWTIVFIDDLGQAPAVVQAACMQLILARRVNGHKVSAKVVFVAATNRREDRAGVTGILEPVKSRFCTILELTPTAEDWIEWALVNNMPTKLIHWVHFRPSMLNTYEVTNDIVNHPCSRTVAAVGHMLNAGIADDDIETIGGAVGQGAAADMVGFFRVFDQMPNIDGILLDPVNASIPTEPAALYAVVTALVEKVTVSNIDRILTYANRLDDDFSMLLVLDAKRKNPKIQNTRAFIDWGVKHQDILL